MERAKSRGLSGAFGNMEALEDEPSVGWLIKDYLAQRELSVIYGPGGTFKSYVALGWTLQLARSGKRTMYIAAEGTSGLRSRVAAWMAKRQLTDEYFPTWHYYNANVMIDVEEQLGVWMNAMEAYDKEVKKQKAGDAKPDLIVVDTLARNFFGDENSAKEMGLFVEGVETLRRELEAAVLVIHHTTKDGKQERGTHSLRNASFCMYSTGNPRYTDAGGGSIELACVRMKDAPTPKPLRVYFDTVHLDHDEYGEVRQLSQAMRDFPKRARKVEKSE